MCACLLVDPLPRGQLWPTGSVGAGHRVSRPRGTGSIGDSVGEGTHGRDREANACVRPPPPLPASPPPSSVLPTTSGSAPSRPLPAPPPADPVPAPSAPTSLPDSTPRQPLATNACSIRFRPAPVSFHPCLMSVCVCVFVCVCVCVCARARACVCVCTHPPCVHPPCDSRRPQSSFDDGGGRIRASKHVSGQNSVLAQTHVREKEGAEHVRETCWHRHRPSKALTRAASADGAGQPYQHLPPRSQRPPPLAREQPVPHNPFRSRRRNASARRREWTAVVREMRVVKALQRHPSAHFHHHHPIPRL